MARFNVAPTDLGWVVVHAGDRRVLRPARWRYETAAKRLLINIRSETLAMGRFGEAFAARRCAVVTDGFYEWPGRGSEPTWFRATDDGLVLLAGLFQPPKVAVADPRFSVLTTRPNALIAPVHDRMPVIVASDDLDEWLTADSVTAVRKMVPAPEKALRAVKVSSRVNSVKNDDPGCIAPRAPPKQGSLF